jgi:hypothetical protein
MPNDIPAAIPPNTPIKSPNATPNDLDAIVTPSKSPTVTPNNCAVLHTPSNPRKLGGRLIGTTKDNILHTAKCVAAAKAEIMHLYKLEYEKNKDKSSKRLSSGVYKKIHDEIKIKRCLPDNFEFSYNNVIK